MFYHPFWGCGLSHLISVLGRHVFVTILGMWAITFPTSFFRGGKGEDTFFPRVGRFRAGLGWAGLSYLAKANVSSPCGKTRCGRPCCGWRVTSLLLDSAVGGERGHVSGALELGHRNCVAWWNSAFVMIPAPYFPSGRYDVLELGMLGTALHLLGSPSILAPYFAQRPLLRPGAR